MSATRELSATPGTPGLLLRAALPLIPGASALPFVAGGGHEVPDKALTLAGARLDSERLAAYARVCAFTLRDTLPVTAPHLLAFPLHMALMNDGSFPFPAVGLVHVSNRIAVHRAIGVEEPLDLHVHATALEPHTKGRTFTIVTEIRVDGQLVWDERSTMLRRGSGANTISGSGSGSGSGSDSDSDSGSGGSGSGSGGSDPGTGSGADATLAQRSASASELLPATTQWSLPDDLGRRYASVSGDRNPIHMHALSARLFGFPRAIAHGMWTKARCLAALDSSLPDVYTVEVAFRKPILLPGKVSFAEQRDGESTSFAVRSTKDQTTIHLEGTVTL
jgi:acyl dehydratase